MDELCFWCLGELCNHNRPDNSKVIHPGMENQVKAVTAYQGTPCCAVCALNIAKILGNLTGVGYRVAASLSIPVTPVSRVMP